MGARVVVVGGGMAGCGAAVTAAKAGAKVVLLERMDVLGGCGNLAGLLDDRCEIARKEMSSLGSAEMFDVLWQDIIHRDVRFVFPVEVLDDDRAEAKWSLADVTKLDGSLRRCLRDLDVEMRLNRRAKDVVRDGARIKGVVTDDGLIVEGDAFIDATGGGGGIGECQRYGNGCVMCFLRCISFGNRVSIAAKAGVREVKGRKKDGSIGAISSGYCLYKASLAPELLLKLERAGCAVIPVPPGHTNSARLGSIATSGKTNRAWLDHAVLLDVGPFVKRSAGGYTPLEELRQIPGLENALYADPMAGTLGNAVRFMAITPRDDTLRVPAIENLFVAGEKVSVNGVAEAAVTGALAGHNAARLLAGLEPVTLPATILVGDFIAYVNALWDSEGLTERYHFFMGAYGRRLKTLPNLMEANTIRQRVDAAGLTGVFGKTVC